MAAKQTTAAAKKSPPPSADSEQTLQNGAAVKPEPVDTSVATSQAADSDTSTWEQCRPELIKDTVTGRRVIIAAKLWASGQQKLHAGDATCVDDLGKAIHLDILGASFFPDLVPRGDGGLGDKLKAYLKKAIEDETGRTPKERVFPHITRAYITFLLTATPQLRGIVDAKEGKQVVQVSADRAVNCDPEDPRLRVIRAGFLSQLGGQRSTTSVAADSRKAIELADSQIKAIESDPNSYVKEEEADTSSSSDKKKGGNKGNKKKSAPSEKKLTQQADEKIRWLRLQRAHANLQLGDLYWGPSASKDDRKLAEKHLKAYTDDATDCDPDMHSACYKLAVLNIWNLPNPKKVDIAPDLVRSSPEKISVALEWYNRAVASQAIHHRWLPSGMDEQTGPIARTWFKVVSKALSGQTSLKNPLVPHPGLPCEKINCPNKFVTPAGEKKGQCRNCLWANYCSRSCQVADWKTHKAACREANGITVITKDGQFRKD